ncbi:MAG: DUF2779 domain-containing protein [Woeseia sp.]
MTTEGPAYLSKSKLVSAWQCLKKLHLIVNRPELAVKLTKTESSFRTGNDVGEIAKRIYGTPEAVDMPYAKDAAAMLRETEAVLGNGFAFPVFEATFRHQGVLVRVDMLLPDGDGWHAIEVKASTSVKRVHLLDCAVQLWVMEGAGLPIKSISVGYVNNRFVYRGDGNYAGLIAEQDVTAEAVRLRDSVIDLVHRARKTLAGDLPDIPVGAHCNKPYECEFRAFCWPLNTEYPVPGLGGSKAKHAEWVNRGFTDIRDLPASEITAERQLRIYRVTCAGTPEILPGAREALAALGYPRYFLDFETVGPAIPIWEGTRPYQAIPVQWSIHVDDGHGDGSLGRMKHAEFLDLSGEPPMRLLAEKMIDALGNAGPVFMYTNYELGVIKNLIDWCPDLKERLQAIIDRLFDLANLLQAFYYHPRMAGSWSIKAAAPAIAPQMDYAMLDGINEGTGASEGFLEAIRADTKPDRKALLEQQLLRYCRFDTEAMVEIVHFLERQPQEAANSALGAHAGQASR